MKLLDIKALRPEGNFEFKYDGCGIRAYTESNASIVSEGFSTTHDSVSIAISAELLNGGATVNLYGCTKDGEKELYRSDSIASGRFSLSYEYDPINLAVYGGMESFFFEIELLPSTRLDIYEFSADASTAVFDVKIERSQSVAAGKKEVPNKMLFIGNSLVFGMKMMYGMCSDAPDKDYFYYVTEYVRSKNSECEFQKLYGSDYEACESLDAFENWYSKDANLYTHQPSGESFTDDIDLIIVQLGDNINTDAKNDTFKVSGDLFVERVKNASPNARIKWVHGWYNRQPTYDYISSLCERWGIERIDIRDLRCLENEAHNQDTYLDKDGTLATINDAWKTHPGNGGMKKIAERIIEYLAF